MFHRDRVPTFPETKDKPGKLWPAPNCFKNVGNNGDIGNIKGIIPCKFLKADGLVAVGLACFHLEEGKNERQVSGICPSAEYRNGRNSLE